MSSIANGKATIELSDSFLKISSEKAVKKCNIVEETSGTNVWNGRNSYTDSPVPPRPCSAGETEQRDVRHITSLPGVRGNRISFLLLIKMMKGVVGGVNNFVGIVIHTLINRKTYGFISSMNEDYLSGSL